ncbi:ATP-binding protein [Noviherbaspirillum pedocola]|uniref:histidine kinase n=1 Tax=Noviherbaspirillum pedocola TaxID=2801341 RepID=A0A934W106_9BURK|nr:ATP-binding protein [Noviherbaspirillum pedocola]MBK4734681.1 two-component sensor histidine kinase [Noviherbaspirillum pedocola]
MDDSKGTVNRSLLWLLSVSICGTILVVGIFGALASFWFAFEEVRDLQDDELREIAQLVSLGDKDAISSEAHPPVDDEPEMRVWVIRMTKAGGNIATPDLSLSLPPNLSDGLHTVDSKGESWRLYVRTLNEGYGLAVAQRTSARDEIARDSALRTLTPFLLVIPILIVLAGFLIRFLLRKVGEVSEEVDKRDDTDLAPLSLQGVPAEIVPFVTATNRLLDRVKEALQQQRHFVADAAHELRSPVTAMTLQLENAMATGAIPGTLASRLAPLGVSLERMRELVEQLLLLAKLEAGAPVNYQRMDGRNVVVEALGEIFPLADSRNVDLGLVIGEELGLYGSEHDFRTLVRNAIQNAVLYTPPGGKVDVRLYRDANNAVLEVEDSGPGIPEELMSRVFDAFYRIVGSAQPGSGLGLAIVRSAAKRLGGEVSLENIRADGKTGLRFVYRQQVTGESIVPRMAAAKI